MIITTSIVIHSLHSNGMRLQGTQGASVAPYLGSPVVLSCRRAKVVGGGDGPMCRVASSLSVKCVACAPKLSSADVPVSPKNPRAQKHGAQRTEHRPTVYLGLLGTCSESKNI